MTILTTRAGKGSPLTNNEMDANLNNLNDYKVEKTSGTGSARLPSGTTAERDGTPQKGWTRYNSTLDILEYWNGTIWVADISSNNPVFTGTLTTDSIINISDPTGVIQVGGDDAVTFDATGIQAGSYKAGSIVAADFADGALIENAPVGIGYGPGAGGTVTQATSKSTSVTLNKPCGQITMNAASLAAGTGVIFTLNNSLVTTADGFSAAISGGSSNPDEYIVRWRVAAGAVSIVIINGLGSPLAEAVQLTFVLLKGATS